jgi:hypothetical protein
MSAATKQAVAEATAEENAAMDEARYVATYDDGADDFDLFALAAPLTLPSTLAQDSAPKNARNDAQLAIDAVVFNVHEAWKDAGEPRTWPLQVSAGVVAGYWVKPASVDKIKKMAKSGADYHKLAIRYGRVTPRSDDMEQDGRVFVSFTILDRRTRLTAQ